MINIDEAKIWLKAQAHSNVHRVELLEVANLIGSLDTDSAFYEKMLCALADGEADAVECDKCGGIYREGWTQGKCPYCEIKHADVFMIVKE